MALADRNAVKPNKGQCTVLRVGNAPGSRLGQPDSRHALDDVHHLTNTQDRDFGHEQHVKSALDLHSDCMCCGNANPEFKQSNTLSP